LHKVFFGMLKSYGLIAVRRFRPNLRDSMTTKLLRPMMTRHDNCIYLLFMLGLLLFSGAVASESKAPEITSQGFNADQPQAGIAGEYPRLRVRIEAQDRISELRIRERSFDVDLAKTKDKHNLQLFGLKQSPRSKVDVTLDLQNYINEKITSEGKYEFYLWVTDKSDNTTEGKISVLVQEAVSPEEIARAKAASLLLTATFSLQRTGTGNLQGGELFGIDWLSIDNAKVAIRIKAAKNNNTRFALLGKPDFDAIQTTDQLVGKLSGIKWTEALVLNTADNRAAGQVFLLRHNGMDYILKVTKSSAIPSTPGTVVTLEGRYKYREQTE